MENLDKDTERDQNPDINNSPNNLEFSHDASLPPDADHQALTDSNSIPETHLNVDDSRLVMCD